MYFVSVHGWETASESKLHYRITLRMQGAALTLVYSSSAVEDMMHGCCGPFTPTPFGRKQKIKKVHIFKGPRPWKHPSLIIQHPRKYRSKKCAGWWMLQRKTKQKQCCGLLHYFLKFTVQLHIKTAKTASKILQQSLKITLPEVICMHAYVKILIIR